MNKILLLVLVGMSVCAFGQDKQAVPDCSNLPPNLHLTITSYDGVVMFDGYIPEPAKELNMNFPSVKIRLCAEKARGGK